MEYTEHNPLRVFTSFSGYDSQCMALDRLKEMHPGFDYELVGWSEIDRHAIKAHNLVYPQYADRNFGDISKIDWGLVPDFDLFTFSSPCQDWSTAGFQKGGAEGKGWVYDEDAKKWFRIRRLTPREIFRLMDVKESDIDRMMSKETDKKGREVQAISNTQLYKCAGNSIVVAPMALTFENLLFPKATEQNHKQLTLF